MAAGLFDGIDTVIMRVQDVDAAVAWYREKLEFEPSFEDPESRLVVFDLGGSTSLTLWQLTRIDVPMVPGAAATYPVFAVADVDEVWNALRDRGVLVEPVVESGGVRWFEFRDLDGNRLEACQVVGGT
jgi:catechol 2,3-dioxygenase-like lactoylglutathione lyase family enzyme